MRRSVWMSSITRSTIIYSETPKTAKQTRNADRRVTNAAVSFFFFFPSAGSAMSLALIVSSERTKQLFSRLPAESFSVSSTRVSSPANTSLSVCEAVYVFLSG